MTGRRRDTCVYHGAPDASRPLLTSLDRLGGVNPPHSKTANVVTNNERRII